MTKYSKEIKTTRRGVENTIKQNTEECMLIGGDFNWRIGERGARKWEEDRKDGKRKSKNKVENAEGKRLMEWIEENGWEILNRNKQGDEEGEWTNIGSRRETVIDYGNEEAWKLVEEFRVGERVESDHLPLEISLEETNHEERGNGRVKEEQKKVIIKIWDDQAVEEDRTRLEKARFEEQDVDRRWR
jgi:endonuclease/exonuclease/phosphatase family metal-dependent hydrolase